MASSKVFVTNDNLLRLTTQQRLKAFLEDYHPATIASVRCGEGVLTVIEAATSEQANTAAAALASSSVAAARGGGSGGRLGGGVGGAAGGGEARRGAGSDPGDSGPDRPGADCGAGRPPHSNGGTARVLGNGWVTVCLFSNR